MKEERLFEVWIKDDNGFCSPFIANCRNKTEARLAGRNYIRAWNLSGSTLMKIVEVDYELVEKLLEQMTREKAQKLLIHKIEEYPSEAEAFRAAALTDYRNHRKMVFVA